MAEFHDDAVQLARAFHELYERLAPKYGYKTREASAVPWDDVPEQNKRLMCHVASELIDTGIVVYDGSADAIDEAARGLAKRYP